MKFLIGVILCYWMCLNSEAQDTTFFRAMLEDPLQISQRPGTESQLRHYLRPVSNGRDTVTAVFFIPSASPRCEALMPEFFRTALAVKPDEQMVLVACYRDADAARAYIQRQHLQEKTILFDTENRFDSIFSTTLGGLYATYTVRVDLRSGRMLVGGNPRIVVQISFTVSFV